MRKIILTNSTLYNVWNYEALRTSAHHMEIEAIVRGMIRHLTRAIMRLYLQKEERLQIIIIVVLNNLGEGQTVEEILDEIHELSEAVEAHSVIHDQTTNPLALCTSARSCKHPICAHWMYLPVCQTGSLQQGSGTGG